MGKGNDEIVTDNFSLQVQAMSMSKKLMEVEEEIIRRVMNGELEKAVLYSNIVNIDDFINSIEGVSYETEDDEEWIFHGHDADFSKTYLYKDKKFHIYGSIAYSSSFNFELSKW